MSRKVILSFGIDRILGLDRAEEPGEKTAAAANEDTTGAHPALSPLVVRCHGRTSPGERVSIKCHAMRNGYDNQAYIETGC